ncbi:MAG: hypothetical protein ACXWXV_08150 [Aeromicrobium sp.]
MKLKIVAAIAVFLMTAACGDDKKADPEPTGTTKSAPSGIASGEPVPKKLDIAPGRIGTVKVGMTKAEAAATGYFDTDVKVGAEECERIEPLQWKEFYQDQVDVITNDSGSIVSMGVWREGLKSDTGISVGSTLGDVQTAYGNLSPAVETGYGQTGVYYTTSEGWIGFLFDVSIGQVTKDSEVSFIEVTKDTRPDLMRDGC